MVRPGCCRRTQTFSPQTKAHERGDDADKGRRLYEDLATVEKVGMAILERGIRKDAVEEEEHRRGKDQVMKLSPERPGEAGAQERRPKNEQEQVERTGTGEVEFGLQRRLNGQKNVEEPESRRVEEKQDHRMTEGEEDGAPGGPPMKEEHIDAPVRPVPYRAVTQRDEQADEQVGGDRSDGAEPKIRAEIQQGHSNSPCSYGNMRGADGQWRKLCLRQVFFWIMRSRVVRSAF